MNVIVGLGNPGDEYARTPHNIGFMVIDRLAGRLEARLKSSRRFEARVGTAVCGGAEVMLVQPQTFMNCSGRSVGALLQYRRLGPAELMVVLDDADLPLGQLRLRKQGGSGGHRGLKSLIEVLGTGEFDRLRVGIGRGGGRSDLVDHVLGRFDETEWKQVEQVTQDAAEAVLCRIRDGMDAAMNRFNARKSEAAAETAGTAGDRE